VTFASTRRIAADRGDELRHFDRLDKMFGKAGFGARAVVACVRREIPQSARMKLLPIIACAALAAFVLPACATKKPAPKATCCSTTGKCDTAHKKHHQ
jgi:hypothetical protein